jgi:hypothetical protein
MDIVESLTIVLSSVFLFNVLRQVPDSTDVASEYDGMVCETET